MSTRRRSVRLEAPGEAGEGSGMGQISVDTQEFIHRRLRELGISQNELARRAGMEKGELSKLMNRQRGPTLRTLHRIASALEVSIGVLLEPPPEDAPSRPPPGAAAETGVVPVEETRSAGAERRPIYRWGAAGDPFDPEGAPARPDYKDYPPPYQETLVGRRGFGVVVLGTSMTRAGIWPLNVCWVNPDEPYRAGDVVCAAVRDGSGDFQGMVIKRWLPGGGPENRDCLRSDGDGPNGRDDVYCGEFRVIGPVVWIVEGRAPR